ncbi:cysteine-rich CWC family protein [Ramlibacter sp. USB13]|uniref:Cysteine-rich CWC family protein n=1 Tax=Ramlibacter cellulosilyticus TaxID=2764187 RepID=A0A923MUS1_9BURK|nr:cysteine-rich CWC family protein [Ramlibacter cellulosilyticus]
MPNEASSPAPSRCPLCGAANRCAMELERETGLPQGPCWCTQAAFGADLLACVPPEAKDRACICQNCARGAAAA